MPQNPASQHVLTSVPRTLPLASWDHYVLVIEDDPEIRDSYRSALRAAGVAAVGTEDGFDALRLAELQRPSAIVIDLVSPRLNGRLVHQTLKSNPHTRDIPVLVINGPDNHDLNFDDVACLLRKPVDAQALVVAVQHVVRHFAPPDRSPL
jgi:CheY-like chemotaxis protein